MQLLWDTHVFLWFIAGSSELSNNARKVIETHTNEHFISIGSLWEISIKASLKKLNIQGSYESVIDDVINNGIKILPINFAHTLQQYQLPFYHRDPFDRMIIAQGLAENMNIISKDEKFDSYLVGKSITRIW